MPKLRPTTRLLSTIDRYILREFALNLLAILSILWLIYIATRFARYLAQAAVGNLPNEVIFTLLGYSSLGALTLLLPLSAFLSVMMVLGRMNVDNELVVMSACGLGVKNRIKQVFIFSGMIALIVGLLALWVVPEVLSERKNIEKKAKIAAETSGLLAGGFKESGDGKWVFYAESLSEDIPPKMEGVFIQVNGDRPLVLRAETGYFITEPETQDRHLLLENGRRYEGVAGQYDFKITTFSRHQILLEKGGKVKASERYRALSTITLWERGDKKAVAELQWRVSSIAMTVILSLLAIVLSQAGPRSGRYAGFFSAILVYIIYSNLLGVSRAWVASDTIPAWFGAIWVHLLMLFLFYGLLLWPRWNSKRMRRQLVDVKGVA